MNSSVLSSQNVLNQSKTPYYSKFLESRGNKHSASYANLKNTAKAMRNSIH